MLFKKMLLKFAGVTVISCLLTVSVFAEDVAIPVPGQGINEDYTLPTQEQIRQEQEKFKEAEKYVKEKREKTANSSQKNGGISIESIIVDGDNRYNSVGTYRQSLGYTCGPTSARNLIAGYIYYNFTYKGLTAPAIPSESTLSQELGTSTDGTPWDATKWQNTLNKYAQGKLYSLKWGTSSNWSSEMSTRVISTIDAVSQMVGLSGRTCFNVVGDLYHGYTTTPIHPTYTNGAAHYICIHGYNNVTKQYFISDSNSAAPVQYKCTYTQGANSTQARGIVW